MIISTECKLIVMDITFNEYKDKVYYQAQVYCPESHESGSIGISDDLAKSIKPDFTKVVTFLGEFNDKFGKLNLKSVKKG